jgi:hypothetical protein
MDAMTLNGVEYVRKDSMIQGRPAVNTDGLRYVIVRTYSAGVFAGWLKTRMGQEVTLLNCRRLWRWFGAASLSQLAQEGTSKPNECKFPCEVSSHILTQAIEILDVTETARKSIAGVPTWTA